MPAEQSSRRIDPPPSTAPPAADVTAADSATSMPRRHWPFFSTPLPVFAGVMGPIGGMMFLLAVLPGIPGAIRGTAGLVVAISVASFVRGYGCRVELSEAGVTYHRPGRAWTLCWTDIRLTGRYVPLDRNRSTQYVFVTTLDAPPVDRREITPDTIQLQDRPGLLEAIEWYRGRCAGAARPSGGCW